MYLVFFESHFEFNIFCYLFGLIKFMWSLLGLTDPCCRINTVTVRVYADGHTEDDSCFCLYMECFYIFFKKIIFCLFCYSFYEFLYFLLVYFYFS